ncbi:hypothetical protein ACP70R_027437 [Stipagrostis hirtigluma subsp. patula]
MRSNLVFIIVVAMVILVVSTAPTTCAPSGGWFPIPNINDAHVQELGGWAVAEHNKKANDRLKFNRVVSGDEQVVAGLKYRFVIDASNPDGQYEAVLTELVSGSGCFDAMLSRTETTLAISTIMQNTSSMENLGVQFYVTSIEA